MEISTYMHGTTHSLLLMGISEQGGSQKGETWFEESKWMTEIKIELHKVTI